MIFVLILILAMIFKTIVSSKEVVRAKLDGVYKPLRKSRTMEEFLQMENDWKPPNPSKPGQKRVRWADLEEQRQQEKMRAIGFVIGTDWNRMMDPTGGSSALTQTKYIERVTRR